MDMIGENQNRIHRQNSSSPANETRWIVPAKPYTPPKGSMESIENAILMGVAVAVIIFGFAVIILSETM